MSGKMLDTDFFNRIKGNAELVSSFHALRQEMFEAQAEEAEAKALAETAKAEEAKTKAKATETKLTAVEEKREIYFSEFGPSFLTDDLAYASMARKAAEAAKLRFSTYVEDDVKTVNGVKKIVGVKLKCSAQVPKKQQKN